MLVTNALYQKTLDKKASLINRLKSDDSDSIGQAFFCASWI
jgi:hypothetical protein